MTRTLSISIKEDIYWKLKNKIGMGNISAFVNQAVKKELAIIIKNEQKQKKQLSQKLIEGYKARSKNKDLQKTLQTYGKASLGYIFTELDRREAKVKKSFNKDDQKINDKK